MATNKSDKPAKKIELTDDELQQVTGGAIATSTTAVIKPVSVREDPCAGGQIARKI